MKFTLMVDKNGPEEITARVRERSDLTDRIEALVMEHTGADRIIAYAQGEIKQLRFEDIACIIVLAGKTYAVDKNNHQYHLKHRLYELEPILPSCFIRINKSAIANETRLERFKVHYTGAVDAVFQCGYVEYVSRRCFAQIKRRYEGK